MRYTQPRYTKLTQEGDKVYLIDEGELSLLKYHLSDVSKAYKDIRTMLKEADLPTERKWIEAVSEKGAEGLEDMVRTQTEEDIKRLNLPKFSANQWRKSCVQDIPSEVWSQAHRLHMEIVNKSEDLPRLEGALSYNKKEGIIIDETAITNEIQKSCRMEVTTEMQTTANRILELAKTIREMEINGLNALELISKYAKKDEEIEDLLLYSDIATRRHAPGRVYDADTMRIINDMALRRFQNQ